MSATEDHFEEPDQLRDQVRQLLRYRSLILVGLVLGLLGGVAVDLLTGDRYTATGEVVVQAISTAPFEAEGLSADKQVSMATERQIAQSAAVAGRAANALHLTLPVADIQRDLQVSNPPQTQTLQFDYTATTPREAARRVNAFVAAYFAYREDAAKDRIDTSVKKLAAELDPLVEQRSALDHRLAAGDDPTKDTDLSERADLVSQIADLRSRTSSLKSLDTTPGEVVRRGDPPAHPAGPGLGLLLLMGAVAGLALGLLGAWVRAVLEPRVRSVADVQDNLRAPVLGILPRGPRSQAVMEVGRPRAGNRAEAYRTIAFRLVHDRRFAGRGSLLVVAPREHSGAVEVAVNLAGAFTEIGNDVLLVEADLRDPLLERVLPVRRTIRDPRTLGEWPGEQRLTVDAGICGEFALVPGRRVQHPARVLSSASFTRLLATPNDPNENVVVLTEPLLSHADGLAVAKRVDGVLVVCDLDRVRRDDLDRVWELVTAAGGRILGAVLDRDGGSGRGGLARLLDGGPARNKRRRDRGAQVPGAPAGGESPYPVAPDGRLDGRYDDGPHPGDPTGLRLP
ncbi:lipopolysaccharide biosynthesis protein [Streptomyces sp. NPDC059740]|uniref:lipopolysaccharide biosynthesis protein n=1 Tax=Streptomyces sp. NPDC059740 TaxID=3346926 RepID=UPI00364E3588